MQLNNNALVFTHFFAMVIFQFAYLNLFPYLVINAGSKLETQIQNILVKKNRKFYFQRSLALPGGGAMVIVCRGSATKYT